MIVWDDVKRLEMDEGNVKQVELNGEVVWTSPSLYGYVSLGDSIAAGHAIDDRWEEAYGVRSQYGENGNMATAIVDGCYTDLIRADLVSAYGEKNVIAKSFARSGDQVADLMEKLTHPTVKGSVKKADLVTVCIGANDVLQPAMGYLGEYVSTGDLGALSAICDANLAALADDSNPNSYTALLDRLTVLNPDAQVAFTAVYNPYRFLWLDEGRDGFFGPLLGTIPSMTIMGFDIDGAIKDQLLGTSYVKLLFERVNGLDAWAEEYVTKLNAVLRGKIAAYRQKNPNIVLAETKALFESFPDRPVSAPKHYCDLVNVEYTRGYDTMQMDWGRLWEGSNAATFWVNLASKYVSLSGFDMGGLAEDLIGQIVEKVIVPDMDPHPEEWGQYVMMRSFVDAFGWTALDRYTVAYEPNGGSGSMSAQTVPGVDGIPAFANLTRCTFEHGEDRYGFTGWNTSASGGGASYEDGQLVGLTSDIVLYAQWAVRRFVLTYAHSQGDVIQFDSGQTGPMECYALYIDGAEQADLGAFSNPAKSYSLPYGTIVKVVASVSAGDGRSYVSWNGTTVAGKSSSASYSFTLTSDATANFEWNQWYSTDNWLPRLQSYWNCYITT